MFTSAAIKDIIQGKYLQQANIYTLQQLAIDSRRIHFANTTLFFAINTSSRNGHQYIADAYAKGVRNFIVSQKIDLPKDANVLLVKNTIVALQQIAAAHRNQFNIEVIGITGSNGKTVVKEWLYQLLQNDVEIVRSPKSYNSQIGVALSVWNLNTNYQLGIFEAGISTTNEMQHLQKIIQPTCGIFTNLGNAHSEGFKNDAEKLNEKLQLFAKCKFLIYNSDNTLMQKTIAAFCKSNAINSISWGIAKTNTIQVNKTKHQLHNTQLELLFSQKKYNIVVPFTDAASLENAMHCICYLLIKQYSEKQINNKLKQLQPVALRLDQKKGQNNCIIINDTYSNDWNSLVIALDYLNLQSSKLKRTVVLTDMQQSGIADNVLYKQVAQLLLQKNVTKLIAIGATLHKQQKQFAAIKETVFLTTLTEVEGYCKPNQFTKEAILFKGARTYALENIAQQLEEKVHQTILEISMEKLIHNVKVHQKILQPTTQIMAVVKAFGYGSGSIEVAQQLQQLGIQNLAVAYADEGVALRKAGIYLPIMVMNIDEAAFTTLLEYDLEPEIFSNALLESFLQFAQKNALVDYPIHIKLDTGMHRLGVEEKDLRQFCQKLQRQNCVRVQTVFSHLVGSEDKTLDAFTKKQNKLFVQMVNTIETTIGYSIIKHIANSAAIERHPNLEHQMVRLGIGMYGVTKNNIGLQQVCALKTTIAQIKLVPEGETVGYNRKGKLKRDSKIATIRIGYADGYNRMLGNGVGKVLVNDAFAPIVGNVCMDMTMIDITDIPNVQEGDYVALFSEALPVQQLATWCHTIPYEILTGISERVKRVYIEN